MACNDTEDNLYTKVLLCNPDEYIYLVFITGNGYTYKIVHKYCF